MSTKRSVFSWCLFDWANSSFPTVIGTFVFSVYFARGVYGDETAGSAVWGYTLSFSGLVVALVSPVIGAIADNTGRLKPWLLVLVLATAGPTALLWYVLPDPAYVAFALAMVVVGSVMFELVTVFYNALLPSVAPRHMMGRVSGWGWGLGYFGGLACLALCLVGFVQPAEPWFGVGRDSAANIRATALVVAVWFIVFSVPLFLFTGDKPPTGLGVRQAVGQGLATLLSTLRAVRSYGQVVRFLIASALYRDGLSTLFAVGGLYAAGTFGLSFEQILLFAIGLNVTAGLGAGMLAWIDDWFGSKRTVLIALAGLSVTGIPILLIDDQTLFIGLALALGIFVGPAQAASRTLMARLSPAHMETEFFGLYALTGRAVAILGPFAFAVATDVFDSQRVGMATIIGWFVIGGIILLGVREPGARKQEE